MANRQSAANQFVRSMLTAIGEHRDLQVLGLAPSSLRGKKIRDSLLSEFNGKCAYCGKEVVGNDFDVDHLVPISKGGGGLHMYGNLVLSCRPCNANKHSHNLNDFLEKFPEYDAKAVKKRLADRAKRFGADLDTKELQSFSELVYQEVGLFLDEKVREGLVRLPAIQVKVAKQAKKQHDFTQIAQDFPLGSRLLSTKDRTIGKVFDYSMEGPKEKRTAYVRFHREPDGKAVTRAPSTLEVIDRF
jgi:hypothetical protein